MNMLYKKSGLILAIVLAIFIQACEDVDPIIENIEFERAFTPLELDVKIRNQLNAEITWTVSQSVDHYVLEIHNDSVEFESLVLTQEIMPADVPITIALESEEQYSVRIKAVSALEDQDESKWGGVAFKTDKENILNAIGDDDLGKTKTDTWVVLSWPANSEVTHFIINPGDNQLQYDLTDDEITAGMATIEGLEFDKEYSVILYNGANPKQRGNAKFTTLPEGITLTAADDLNEMITNAQNGEVFLLEGGEYNVYQGMIDINKSVKLKGLSSENMPVLNVQFVITDGAALVELESIEMLGQYDDAVEGPSILDHVIQFSGTSTSVGDVILTGCRIHQYNKSLVSGSSGEFTVSSIVFEDCLVSDIFNDGGDFIDFRKSFPQVITLSNTTFANCATVNVRDFIRLDGNAKGNTFDDGAHTPEITIESCTFYNVMNSTSSTKRLFYVRWQNSDEVLTVNNCLFSEMGNSVYSNQSDTNMPTFSNNNYHNAASYFSSDITVYDNTGNYTQLDPGFVSTESYDFTLSNQTIIDAAIGATRWR